jgi:hypothetical protein
MDDDTGVIRIRLSPGLCRERFRGSRLDHMNKTQTRSVVVNGEACELKLRQEGSGKWAVLGLIPSGGGATIAGCISPDDAVKQWLRVVSDQIA